MVSWYTGKDIPKDDSTLVIIAKTEGPDCEVFTGHFPKHGSKFEMITDQGVFDFMEVVRWAYSIDLCKAVMSSLPPTSKPG